MKQHIISFGIMLLCFTSFGQEHILSSGLNINNSNGSVSYSVGLIHYKDASGIGGSTLVGSQLPFEVSELLSVQDLASNIVSVHPNPTSGLLYIRLNTVDTYKYQLIDLSGRLLKTGEVSELETTISLTGIDTAIYILNIEKNNTTVKSYKISKK